MHIETMEPVSLPATRLTSRIFLWDLEFYRKTGSWSQIACSILNDLDCADVFHNLNVCDLQAADASPLIGISRGMASLNFGITICTKLTLHRKITFISILQK